MALPAALFWTISGATALLGLLACRRWASWALFLVTGTVVLPYFLAALAPHDSPLFRELPSDAGWIAAAVVLLADLVGLALGRFRPVLFFPWTGRVPGDAPHEAPPEPPER